LELKTATDTLFRAHKLSPRIELLFVNTAE